jgi:hypothetical protein
MDDVWKGLLGGTIIGLFGATIIFINTDMNKETITAIPTCPSCNPEIRPSTCSECLPECFNVYNMTRNFGKKVSAVEQGLIK